MTIDLEILEALAVSDRAAALAQLLPGSENHDFYRCLFAQHAGSLDDAAAIIDAWPDRHGATERYEQLRFRQQLYRLGDMSDEVVDEIRDRFGVNHWHEAEVPEVDPTRASVLAADSFDGAAILRQAVASDANLSQVTEDGIYELIDPALDVTRQRAVLSRLEHTNDPNLVPLIAAELATRNRNVSSFGDLTVHQRLTLAQLHELAELRPDLRSHRGWISAVVFRLRPPWTIDLVADLQARTAYIEELWAFVRDLPGETAALRRYVLWCVFDNVLARDLAVDYSLFRDFVAFPRDSVFAGQHPTDAGRRDEQADVQSGVRSHIPVTPNLDEEQVIRGIFAMIGLHNVPSFASYFERGWFEAELATLQLVMGDAPNAEAATRTLGPARAQALREKVELQWAAHNPTRFGIDTPIAVELDVKNVPELVVKVFRIDPIAYFQHHGKEIATDVDLDGLAASHEEVRRYSDAPVRRVRRQIELPMCARPGTYVIDVIGNGMSSRVVVHKGRMRYVARRGAQGHVVTIVDDAGRARSDARVWLGGREYVPDQHGAVIIPFSTRPGVTPMLLACGDVTSVETIHLERESYALAAEVWLERESLTAGRSARAIITVRLTVAGAEASTTLLKRPMVDLALTDRGGTTTTKSVPLELTDEASAVIDVPLGDDPANLAITVTGGVDVISEQREDTLRAYASTDIQTSNAGTRVEALYLVRTADHGWVLHALGRTGEPRAHRPVTVGLVHRWSTLQINHELATDASGRIVLGELPGLVTIVATLGQAVQRWSLDVATRRVQLAAAAGGEIVVALPPARDAAEVIRRVSIVEMSRDAIVRHPQVTLVELAGAIVIRDLQPGTYMLRGPGVQAIITIAPPAPAVARWSIASTLAVELVRSGPAIAELVVVDNALRIALRDAGSRTRVHVIARRFESAPIATPAFGARLAPGVRYWLYGAATYLSGRDIGDEYRYILERRGATRYPNLLLDKPSLLLNPWSRRTTTTDVAHARGGGGFAPPRPAMMAPGAPMPQAAPMRGVGGSEPIGYDFVGEPPVVLANLRPDARGVITIPLVDLGRACTVTVICDDPAATTWRDLPLADSPVEPRDLRLILALDPSRHVARRKLIQPLVAGQQLVIDDLATAQVHLIDSVERAYAYLQGLGVDSTLGDFNFITRWQALDENERRERYSKHACHELNLFVFFKDRPWFDAVIAPYLVNKRTKTFIDHWLLGADLVPYLEPCKLTELNAIERALLAQRMEVGAALARLLADEVAVIPPDPALDTRLIDALLGASTLHGDDEITGAHAMAKGAAMASALADMPAMERSISFGTGGPPPAAAAAPMTRSLSAKKMAKEVSLDKADEAESYGRYDDDGIADDAKDRREAAPMFRAADLTQEWAENNWWHRTPGDSRADMITPNRLWRDLAMHRSGRFLSPWLGLATESFAEAMVALAVIDLPFAATQHTYAVDGPRMVITAGSTLLAGSSQLVDGQLVDGGPPLVVGTTYVRDDDRHDWVDGEQVDKYVEGFVAGVVYTCRVVLANPTSARQRVAALLQVPRGSVPVNNAKATHTIDVLLAPYATHGHEYSFYFPAPGAWTHFPVHVTRNGEIVAAGLPRTLEVGTGAVADDPRSWPHLSQRGSLADVVDYLRTANLAATDVERAAWRLRERPAYDGIVGVLEARHRFDPAVWAYALYHKDVPRTRAWLRSRRDELHEAGPVLDMAMVDLDGEDLGSYEHLELAPLTNARAHRLGPKLRILNDGLAEQYTRFLDLVTHRRAPTARDRLAAAHYFLAQDRVDAAVAQLTLVPTGAVAERMQHDYLAAYAACLVGELPRARSLAEPWREIAVDRWRHRFVALLGMLDEIDGAKTVVVDPKSRDQQHADLASRQPTFELAVDRDGVVIRAQYVPELELRFFEMDIELLFSRQPFVSRDVSRFSFIEPGHRERVTPGAELRVPWPPAMRGKNVVVEAVAAGARQAKIHYANDLATTLANQYGQIRVVRASDKAPLVATYVKVYARTRSGGVAFYKDGYTDLRGWFDYATLSTSDLDGVERFAVLVCSDRAGSAILEADPPQR